MCTVNSLFNIPDELKIDVGKCFPGVRGIEVMTQEKLRARNIRSEKIIGPLRSGL